MEGGGNARSRNVPRENKKEGKRPSILLRASQNERVPKKRKRVLQRVERSIMEHREKKKRTDGGRMKTWKGGWMQSRKVTKEDRQKNRKKDKSA